MVTAAKKATRVHSSHKNERTIVYRGIKIVPVQGKRSPTAKALRDALRAKLGRPRGHSTHG